MVILLASLIAIPLVAGGFTVLTSWRVLRPVTHTATLAATGLTALCALLLLPFVGSGQTIEIEWLPGAGSMAVGLGGTGLYAALVTVWGAFLALLGARAHDTSDSPVRGAVILFALAASIVAFLAQHFLARYVALEIAALCVAMMPIVQGERVDPGSSRSSRLVDTPPLTGSRLSQAVYLILRLGDAGLLVAILILADASGTLDIAAALESGSSLDAARLRWAVAGFLLAVWVKMGVWPFHVWIQAGHRLSLSSYAWLYATVMPNLGLYLLYRVAPLLAIEGTVRAVALWLGAACAVLCTFGAWVLSGTTGGDGAASRTSWRLELAYLGAAQGASALLVAASGLKPVVWVILLITTPLRLLLFLSADAAHGVRSMVQRRIATGFWALGGLGVVAFWLLIAWWVRQAGAPLGVVAILEVAIGLAGIWAVRSTWRLARSGPTSPNGSRVPWGRWGAMGLLGGGVLAVGVALGPMLRHLSLIGHVELPTLPTALDLLRRVAIVPALLAIAIGVVESPLRRRFHAQLLWLRQRNERVWATIYDLEGWLARMARGLRVIEVSIQEGLIPWIARGLVGGANALYRFVEQKILGDTPRWAMQTIVRIGKVDAQYVEQRGFEGILYHLAQGILASSRLVQRWHTGRLRRNLTWLAVSLTLAVLCLTLCSW